MLANVFATDAQANGPRRPMAQLSDATMLARTGACSNQRAFVTLVSGEEYARPACCLRRQLLRVGSTCPMHVVIDDRNGSGTGVGLQAALRACGFNRTYSLTSLISSVRGTSAPPHSRRLLQSPQPQLHGRRLLHGGPAGVAATSAKLWLWALPLELVAFLDVDVFVAKDIDELLLQGLDGSLGAVSSRVQEVGPRR